MAAAAEVDLRAYVTERMAALGVPGVVVGIHQRGQPPLTVGLGITNARAPLQVGDHTLFQIGSTTKTFTALAVLILVDRGLVTLDARLAELCPDFALPSPAAAATVSSPGFSWSNHDRAHLN